MVGFIVEYTSVFLILERGQLIILLLHKLRVNALSPKYVSVRIVVYCLHTRSE